MRVPATASYLLPAIVVLGLVSAPRTAWGQGRTIALESFDAHIDVRKDASIDVTETLRIRFDGSWNGISRDISLQHRTASGYAARLDLKVGAVTDENGQALKVERSNSSGSRRLKIWVPDANDATRIVVIHYTVSNGLRFFDTKAPSGLHDELYWNVTGNAWTMPIRRARVEVVLPEGVDSVRAWAYTGPAGSTAQDADVRVNGRRVDAVTRASLAEGEGLTVSVSWPPGLVVRPGVMENTADAVRWWWPLAVPFIALVLMLRIWQRNGRDPDARPIVVQYEPPQGLTPSEAGTLVDHDVDIHDITATLVDLAVRGYVLIEEKKEKHLLGLFLSTDYYFRLRRPRETWTELAPHEREYLQSLFKYSDPDCADGDGAETVKLSDLKNKFYKEIPGIRTGIYDRLVSRGLYRKRPDKVRAHTIGFGVLLGVVGVAGAIWASEGAALAGTVPLLIGGLVAAAVVLAFAFIMPARTVAGQRMQEAALGFREFLERVESPRYKMMITSPDLFEKYLPYAMAFEVEDRWAKAFDDMLQTPPTWYVGTGNGSFHPTAFTHNLGAMSSAAGSTMASSPSGSGGGGSSGGGSGGGGGSGF